MRTPSSLTLGLHAACAVGEGDGVDVGDGVGVTVDDGAVVGVAVGVGDSKDVAPAGAASPDPIEMKP
jgi:hypothetical protein